MALTPSSIARVVGAPLANVEANWPLVLASLDHCGILTPAVEIAAAATIGVECPTFAPQREKSPKSEDRIAYFTRMYWDKPNVRHSLGNATVEDAVRLYGRGLIQITGTFNYELYGHLLGLNLLKNPDLALEPKVAADILALFFSRERVDEAANAGDWKRSRIRVNGGLNGWEQYEKLVIALQK